MGGQVPERKIVYSLEEIPEFAPGLSIQLIIGAKTMQAWRFKLDFEADEVIIDPRVTRLRL